MKQLSRVLTIVLAIIMCVSALASCSLEDWLNPTTTTTTTEKPVEDNTVKVYWYEGTKELRVDEVEPGTVLESWIPTSESGEFVGWYAEASKETPFDFTQPVTEETNIFAKFKSNEFAVDPNEYYFIGTGAGDMGKSSWDHAKSAANLMMTKEENDKANVYTITITMYAGDMFQICFGGAWDGQQGIGFMKDAAYADGVNFYDNKEYKAEDKKYAEVKDAEGNVVFIGSDEYNKGFESWNIKLADGMDGVYKFTFTTNPAAKEFNLLTWELVEKLEPMSTTHDMHFIGTMNGWSTTYEEGELALKASDDKATWTGFITITEDMYEDWTATDENNPHGEACAALKIFNAVNGEYYSPDGNNVFLKAGTYAFKYTVEGNKVEYAALDYYVVGTFVDADGAAVNFAVKEGVTPKLENGSVTLTAVDVTALGDFSWIKDQGKPGIMAVKVVYGCELGIRDWFSDDANGGDNFYLAAGEYTITLADGVVTVAPVVAE